MLSVSGWPNDLTDGRREVPLYPDVLSLPLSLSQAWQAFPASASASASAPSFSERPPFKCPSRALSRDLRSLRPRVSLDPVADTASCWPRPRARAPWRFSSSLFAEHPWRRSIWRPDRQGGRNGGSVCDIAFPLPLPSLFIPHRSIFFRFGPDSMLSRFCLAAPFRYTSSTCPRLARLRCASSARDLRGAQIAPSSRPLSQRRAQAAGPSFASLKHTICSVARIVARYLCFLTLAPGHCGAASRCVVRPRANLLTLRFFPL